MDGRQLISRCQISFTVRSHLIQPACMLTRQAYTGHSLTIASYVQESARCVCKEGLSGTELGIGGGGAAS